MAENHESPQDFTIKKKVDEGWKDSVEKEKGHSPEEEAPSPPIEPDFPFFISTLGMQALAALGEAADPTTHVKKTDLNQAHYLIDILGVLQAKTKGNLSPEEESMLRNLLYELRMKFVEKTKKP